MSGTVAGYYTTTKPYAPIHLVYVAIVLRSHPTLGVLGVKIQNGYEMDELHNVSAQSPSNNDGLFYNTSTSLWSKNTIAGVLGYTPVTSARTISTTSPLSGGGDLTADRTLSIAQATTSVNGYLSSTDWNTFNGKQSTITLTTTGTSGAATLVGATLNIPQYAAGTGTVTSVAALTLGTTGTDLSSTVATGTTTPVITLQVPTASATNRGALSSADWTTFNGKFTLPSLTSGSVLFSNGTTIAQDNANFFWDNTNNLLGIGTATPYAKITTSVSGTFTTDSNDSDYSTYGLWIGDTNPTNAIGGSIGFGNITGGRKLAAIAAYHEADADQVGLKFYVQPTATGSSATLTEGMYLTSQGNLGINTATPDSKIHAYVSSGSIQTLLKLENGSVSASSGSKISFTEGGVERAAIISQIGTGTTPYLSFENNAAERMRIFSDGNVGVNTGATNAGYKLDVNGTGRFQDNLLVSKSQNAQTSTTISNTTAGTSSAAGLIMTSDASSGNGIIAKLSSTHSGSAIATADDFTLLNYTAGDIVLLNTFATGLIKFGVGTSTSAQMTMTNDGHLLIGTVTNSTYHLDINGDANANKINLAAGTATRAPLDFTPTSAVLKTTPIAGDTEVSSDGKLYYTHNTSERGVIDAFQFFKPNAIILLVSQTAVQPIFNTITNGAVTLKSATNYYFECYLYITGMSTTSGSFGFAIAGTATFSNISWNSIGSKAATLTTAAAPSVTHNISAANNATLVTASTAAAGWVLIKGRCRILAGGTFIPQISLGIAAAASINQQSYFKITAISDNLTDYIGNWS